MSQIPVAGNLLHHAIEMYLKGALAEKLSLQQLKTLSHDLRKIWATFKAQFPDPSLDTFDVLVDSLHAFEELRYPDSIVTRGMAVRMGVTRDPTPAPVVLARPVPTYELYLTEIDALVGKILQVAAVNPAFFVSGLTASARQYLKKGNAQPWAG